MLRRFHSYTRWENVKQPVLAGARGAFVIGALGEVASRRVMFIDHYSWDMRRRDIPLVHALDASARA